MSAILLLASVVVFVLVVFGVDVGDVGAYELLAAGLALFAASFAVGPASAFIAARRANG